MNGQKNFFPSIDQLQEKASKKAFSFFEKINPEFKRIKFRSGKKVFDWKIPLEWNIEDAYIQHVKSGKKFCEFKKNNLHIVSYSQPINKTISKKELIKKIYTQKDQINSIPYVTSYYKKSWGFCMSEKQKRNLPRGQYKVYINSSFKKGTLDLSHCILKGKSKKEIFLKHIHLPSFYG